MPVEEFAAQIVTRRARQMVVVEHRIVVETEIVERVGEVQPQSIGVRAADAHSLQLPQPDASFDAAMTVAFGVADVAVAERT